MLLFCAFNITSKNIKHAINLKHGKCVKKLWFTSYFGTINKPQNDL